MHPPLFLGCMYTVAVSIARLAVCSCITANMRLSIIVDGLFREEVGVGVLT